MRPYLNLTTRYLIVAAMSYASITQAQDAVTWSDGFDEADATHFDNHQPQDQLVVNTFRLLVITNDVAPEWFVASKGQRQKETPIIWCLPALKQAISRIDSSFFHPSSPILGHRIPIGLPPILTGGKHHADVPRAFIIVTDGRYRFLEMMVGVPDDDALANLIQDAEETRMWMHQYCGNPSSSDPNGMADEIVNRNQARLGRLWNEELDRLRRTLGDDAYHTNRSGKTVDPIHDSADFTELFLTRLRSIAGQLKWVYLQDAQSRFGLLDRTDIKRLAILEQHPDTRQSWASCLSTFAVGADVRKTYLPLAEVVWDRRVMPIRSATGNEKRDAADSALSAWIASQGTEHPFALRLPLSLMAGRGNNHRLSISEVAQRRGLGWADLDAELQKLPVYQTDPLQLATWLHRTAARPIDLNRPSPTQILFFRSASDQAYPIRDGEPPGRSVTMIRKVQR